MVKRVIKNNQYNIC